MSPLIESTTWLKWKIDIAHSNKSWQIPAKSLKKNKALFKNCYGATLYAYRIHILPPTV